jgi:signal peptidase I
MRRRWTGPGHIGITLALLSITAFCADCLDVIRVRSASMNPTYKDDDYLVALLSRCPCNANHFKQLHAGDVVVARVPVSGQEEPVLFLKRVVAVAGDHLKTVSGTLIRNGGVVMESYIHADFGSSSGPFEDIPELTVPQGTVFLLGDNRKQSIDSRFWGPVEESAIVGRILFAL